MPGRLVSIHCIFLSTPSARRATTVAAVFGFCTLISIHALREEGDAVVSLTGAMTSIFLSTPSARRATSVAQGQGWRGCISIHALREEGDEPTRFFSPPGMPFLSTPSARRATRLTYGPFYCHHISIHALREEGDNALSSYNNYVTDFYPRPPRGGRRHRPDHQKCLSQFLSTPSARRAT